MLRQLCRVLRHLPLLILLHMLHLLHGVRIHSTRCIWTERNIWRHTSHHGAGHMGCIRIHTWVHLLRYLHHIRLHHGRSRMRHGHVAHCWVHGHARLLHRRGVDKLQPSLSLEKWRISSEDAQALDHEQSRGPSFPGCTVCQRQPG